MLNGHPLLYFPQLISTLYINLPRWAFPPCCYDTEVCRGMCPSSEAGSVSHQADGSCPVSKASPNAAAAVANTSRAHCILCQKVSKGNIKWPSVSYDIFVQVLNHHLQTHWLGCWKRHCKVHVMRVQGMWCEPVVVTEKAKLPGYTAFITNRDLAEPSLLGFTPSLLLWSYKRFPPRSVHLSLREHRNRAPFRYKSTELRQDVSVHLQSLPEGFHSQWANTRTDTTNNTAAGAPCLMQLSPDFPKSIFSNKLWSITKPFASTQCWSVYL